MFRKKIAKNQFNNHLLVGMVLSVDDFFYYVPFHVFLRKAYFFKCNVTL